jgi:Protein of unknown function (Hypoth_ymh)
VARDLEKTNDHNAFMITRLGRRVAAEGLEQVRAIQRLSVDLHPELGQKVLRQYLMGDYETAAFVAMKAIEVRVRAMSKAPSSLVGVALMRKAFGDGGPCGIQRLMAASRMPGWASLPALSEPSKIRRATVMSNTKIPQWRQK